MSNDDIRLITLECYDQQTTAAVEPRRDAPFRLSVHSVVQGEAGGCGAHGMIAGGAIRVGDRIRIQPSGRESRIAGIFADGRDSDQAVAGQAVILTFSDPVEVSSGDLVSAADAPAGTSDQFEVTVIWHDDEPLFPGRPYRVLAGGRQIALTITDIKYRVNTATGEHVAAKTLGRDEIGICNLSLDQTIAFDPFVENQATGRLDIVVPRTRQVVGTGLIHFALRRAQNIHIQHTDVNRAARATIKGQRPGVLWFTGLSGSGKSTIANRVETRLHALGKHTYLLDGDNVRHGLNKDLGFTEADRVENIRRIAEVARLMADAGLIVITAFISPFRAERRMARGLLPEGEFIEVFVDTPLAVAEERDVKGLYKKARRGELKNFTGIDSPYETPEAPEMRLDTVMLEPDAAADSVVAELRRRGMLAHA